MARERYIPYHHLCVQCSDQTQDKVKFYYNIQMDQHIATKILNDSRFELQDSVCCSIPEAVKYHEFQESLLSQDYY